MANSLYAPLSWLYGISRWGLNVAYDMKLTRRLRLPISVVSVGSLIEGGSGRTPFIEYLIRYYIDRGIKVCVIMRGYKRTSKDMQVVSDGKTVSGTALLSGDQPYQIAKKFPQVIIVVDDKYPRAVDYVMKLFHARILILDDAFQLRSIARDMDILMIDGRLDISKIPLYPAGRRREPLSALRRADLCVFTNVSSSSQAVLNGLKKYTNTPAIGIRYIPKEFRSLTTSEVLSIADFKGVPCIVFCGIDSPQGFKATVAETGLEIAEFFVYADHCAYSRTELSSIKRHFEMRKARFIITSETDAVRLQAFTKDQSFPWKSCYYLETEASVVAGQSTLNYVLKEKIDNELRSQLIA